MSDRLFFTLFAIGIYVVIVVALIVGSTRARAHDWYPGECCSDKDCAPLGEAMQEPLPRAMPGGWLLADGYLVPYAQARPSPDGKFHVCRRNGERTGAVITPDKRPVCFWAPQPSF